MNDVALAWKAPPQENVSAYLDRALESFSHPLLVQNTQFLRSTLQDHSANSDSVRPMIAYLLSQLESPELGAGLSSWAPLRETLSGESGSLSVEIFPEGARSLTSRSLFWISQSHARTYYSIVDSSEGRCDLLVVFDRHIDTLPDDGNVSKGSFIYHLLREGRVGRVLLVGPPARRISCEQSSALGFLQTAGDRVEIISDESLVDGTGLDRVRSFLHGLRHHPSVFFSIDLDVLRGAGSIFSCVEFSEIAFYINLGIVDLRALFRDSGSDFWTGRFKTCLFDRAIGPVIPYYERPSEGVPKHTVLSTLRKIRATIKPARPKFLTLGQTRLLADFCEVSPNAYDVGGNTANAIHEMISVMSKGES